MKVFSKDATQINIGRSDVAKYLAYQQEPPYFLIFSQRKDKREVNGYHSVFSVCSESIELDLSVIEEFQRKTGVRLRSAPKPLVKLMKMADETGTMLEKLRVDPRTAVEDLKEMYSQIEFMQFCRAFKTN
jgi:hypothetical protein